MKIKINKLYFISLITTLLGLISTILMVSFSSLDTENPGLIEAFIAISFILSLCSTFSFVLDKFKIGYILNEVFCFANVVISFTSLMVLLTSRLSYAIFFFCGDIMGTGLSLFMILGIIFLLASFILNLVSYVLTLKNKKEEN